MKKKIGHERLKGNSPPPSPPHPHKKRKMEKKRKVKEVLDHK